MVDFAICRSASWFAGWTSSSFTVTLAHYRHLDYSRAAHAATSSVAYAATPTLPPTSTAPPDAGGDRPHYYAYCSASKPGRGGWLAREMTSGRLRLHTCKKPSKRALERQQTAALEAAAAAKAVPHAVPETAAEARAAALRVGSARATAPGGYTPTAGDQASIPVAAANTLPAAAKTVPAPDALSSDSRAADAAFSEVRAADEDPNELARVEQLSALLDTTAGAEEEAIRRLFATHACNHVYLDVGSNVSRDTHTYPPQSLSYALALRLRSPFHPRLSTSASSFSFHLSLPPLHSTLPGYSARCTDSKAVRTAQVSKGQRGNPNGRPKTRGYTCHAACLSCYLPCCWFAMLLAHHCYSR